jgi:hypothetical protein
MSTPHNGKSCELTHLDGSYVLGALSPAERLEFEQHLAGCKECSRSVRELAGLPGLLARVDAEVLEEPATDEPLPDTLLPALSREVRRTGRRRGWVRGGLAAAAVAAVLGGIALGGLVGGGDTPSAGPTTSQTSTTASPQVRMRPVGHVPVRATVGLASVSWGTRLDLTCTYAPDSPSYEDLPPTVTYALVVHTRDGHTERVGTWRATRDRAMEFTAGTSANPRDIASVEVTTTDGRPVLRLLHQT